MQQSSIDNNEFELSSSRVSTQDQTPISRKRGAWHAIKSWYFRTVLRSGRGYDPLPDQKPSLNQLHGWRLGALSSCVLVGICLSLNVAMTIRIRTHYPPNDDNLGVMMGYECSHIRSIDSKLHYAINVIATILVGASNYNMQCLTAPSQKEVVRAHAQGKWLDIGVHSPRNLPHISVVKSLLWLALLFSSLPLHLLWNSAVFTTTTFNDYSGLVVTSSFLDSDSDIGINCTAHAMNE